MCLIVIATIVASLLLTPVARRIAWKVDAVSRPDGTRRTHARPTPELGGIAILGSLILAVGGGMLVGTHPGMSPWLVVGLGLSAIAYCLLGFMDDRIEMKARAKLIGQVLAAAPVVATGCYLRQIDLFGWDVSLGPLGIPLTFCWIVLIVNAMNLIDGMDGQASMIGILVSLAVALIATAQNQGVVLLMAMGLAGGLAGFLWFNLPPASIYLGDCGSMLVGFLLAVLTMQASTVGGTTNMTAAVCLLLVPLVDTSLAVVRRLANGKGVMVGDRAHIHHRLQDRGYGIWGTLAIVGGLAALAGGVGTVSAVMAWHVPALLSVVAATAVCIQLRLFGTEELGLLYRRLTHRSEKRPEPSPPELVAPQVFRLADESLLDGSVPRPLATPAVSNKEDAA